MSSSSTYQPRIKYLSSSPNGDVVPDKSGLDSPIPLHLSDLDGIAKSGSTAGLTYHRYLETIKDFLSRDSYHFLIDALRKQTGKSIALRDIESITIRSEKHGALYHIASIDVITADDISKFVATSALSERGKLYLESDFYWLQSLHNKYAFSYLPRVYHQDQVCYQSLEGTRQAMLISLGEWLEGYHEFHLSLDKSDGRQKIVVWDLNNGYYYLSAAQSHTLYRLASLVLTLYYDTDTFHQISLWHHSAGDFIVRVDGENIDLKLVTVRRYEPMIGFSTNQESNKIAALIHFFLHLSIRMRMDRLDGVGVVAWADDFCLDAIMKGFYQALEIKEKMGGPAAINRDEFLAGLKGFSREDWIDMAHATLETYPQPEADVPLIRRNLNKHLERLHAVIRDFAPDSSTKIAD